MPPGSRAEASARHAARLSRQAGRSVRQAPPAELRQVASSRDPHPYIPFPSLGAHTPTTRCRNATHPSPPAGAAPRPTSHRPSVPPPAWHRPAPPGGGRPRGAPACPLPTCGAAGAGGQPLGGAGVCKGGAAPAESHVLVLHSKESASDAACDGTVALQAERSSISPLARAAREPAASDECKHRRGGCSPRQRGQAVQLHVAVQAQVEPDLPPDQELICRQGRANAQRQMGRAKAAAGRAGGQGSGPRG